MMKPADFAAPDHLVGEHQSDAEHGARRLHIDVGDTPLGDGRDRQGSVKKTRASVVRRVDRSSADLVIGVDTDRIGKWQVWS